MNTITNLAHLGQISVAGPDAKKFLQGQLTCHLDEITTTQSRLGAHCNPQGRIISFFRLFLFNDSFYLQMPRELIPIALKALQKYAVFFKVKLHDASDELVSQGYIGDSLKDVPQEVDEQLTQDEYLCIKILGEVTRYLYISKTHKIPAFDSATSGKEEEWKRIDIASRIPTIYPETSERFLPHEIDLPKLNAVSFDKGCYTGQEIIARMQYRGKLKKHLYHASIKTALPLNRGDDIYLDNKSCGNIVDFAQIDYNNYELLVIAQESDVATGNICIDADKKHTLEFLGL